MPSRWDPTWERRKQDKKRGQWISVKRAMWLCLHFRRTRRAIMAARELGGGCNTSKSSSFQLIVRALEIIFETSCKTVNLLTWIFIQNKMCTLDPLSPNSLISSNYISCLGPLFAIYVCILPFSIMDFSPYLAKTHCQNATTFTIYQKEVFQIWHHFLGKAYSNLRIYFWAYLQGLSLLKDF